MKYKDGKGVELGQFILKPQSNIEGWEGGKISGIKVVLC